MPRKINCGVRYDEEYDAYEDYDNDYDVEENVENKQETVRPGLWRCSICTYDNEEGMSTCDICGVLRNPPVDVVSNGYNKADPFKFDVPSPDDLVSNGMRSSSVASKGSLTVPSVSNEKKDVAVKTQAGSKMSDGSSILVPKVKKDTVKESLSSLSEDKAQTSTSSLTNMSSSVKHGQSTSVNGRRAKSLAQYNPESWMLLDHSEERLTQLNLAIVGHVDSGKSTLSGRLLHLLGRVSQKEMHKYEKDAKLQGKGSFAYAWALDESAEERERGITMTVAVAYFDTNKYHVVVLDSPGHKDFVPNMISGATQADAAILVIDASLGSFEAGMDTVGGQTREHAQLVRSFGVDQIIVAVNKMDVVQYSKKRFDFIKQQVGRFLRSIGFRDSFMSWVPLSAIENQNLVAPASDARLMAWYEGSYLLDAIDSLQPPKRDFSKPLLLPICDVVKSNSLGQVFACGKLEAGAIRSGSKVLVMPSGDIGTVRSLERDSKACPIARAGDNVAVSLQGIDANRVVAGGVLCHPDFPVVVAAHLELKVLVLDAITTPILIGFQMELHIHHAKEAARVVRISSLLDSKTGKVTKKAPRCLTARESAVLEVALNGAVCVEEFANSRALGRVFLRSSGRTIAVGIVTRIIDRQES